MHILLYGEDTFRSKEKLGKIREKYCQSVGSGLSISKISGPTATAEEIAREILALPFLENKRLILIDNLLVQGSPLVCKQVMELLPQIPETTVAVFWEGGLSKDSELFSALKKGACEKFDILEGMALMSWIREKVLEAGGTIQNEAVSFLAQAAGGDLWRLSNEIAKLAAYSKEITLEIVKEMVSHEDSATIFELTDAICTGNLKLALASAQKLLSLGEIEITLLARIASTFRNMILVKDFLDKKIPQSTIVAETKLHPYVVKKTAGFCQNFSKEKLVEAYEKIFETDYDLKSGRGEPSALLTVLLCELAGQGAI